MGRSSRSKTVSIVLTPAGFEFQSNGVSNGLQRWSASHRLEIYTVIAGRARLSFSRQFVPGITYWTHMLDTWVDADLARSLPKWVEHWKTEMKKTS
jgi:hypothetical protein